MRISTVVYHGWCLQHRLPSVTAHFVFALKTSEDEETDVSGQQFMKQSYKPKREMLLFLYSLLALKGLQ